MDDFLISVHAFISLDLKQTKKKQHLHFIQNIAKIPV